MKEKKANISDIRENRSICSITTNKQESSTASDSRPPNQQSYKPFDSLKGRYISLKHLNQKK